MAQTKVTSPGIADDAVTVGKIPNTSITNAKLANSSITINSSPVSLGGSVTVGETKPTSGTLKFGMLFVGIAVGILLGNILEVSTQLEEEVAYFSMVFLFGGAGLIINYFVEKADAKK